MPSGTLPGTPPGTPPGTIDGAMERWREWIEGDVDTLARHADGSAAVVRAGRVHYVAGWPDATLLRHVMRHVAAAAGLACLDLDGVRLRRRGGLTFAFNYGDTAWAIPGIDPAALVLGAAVVPPQDLACWRG